jgi:hypothetical protein
MPTFRRLRGFSGFKSLGWAIFVVIAFATLAHFQNQNNDFRVFWNTANSFLRGENPWKLSRDPNAMYLNGAATLFIYLPFGALPYSIALSLLRILNILSLLYVTSFLLKRNSGLFAFTFCSLLLLTFPFRSSMEYGQFSIIYSCLALRVAINITEDRELKIIDVISVGLLLDFKPHVFFPILILMFARKKYSDLWKTLLFLLTTQLLVGIWINALPIIEWMNAINYRSKFVSNGGDSFSLISQFGLDPTTSLLIELVFTVLLYIFVVNKKDFSYQDLIFTCAVGLLSIPLLHPTDLMLICILFTLAFRFTPFDTFVLGIFLVWSPRLSGVVFALISCMFVLIFNSMMERILSLRAILFLLLPTMVYLGCINIGLDEVRVRHSLHFLVLILLLLRNSETQIVRNENLDA